MPDEVVENLDAAPEGITATEAQTEQGDTAEESASEEITDASGEGSEFVMPDKFKGKSAEEVARAYSQLEKKLGRRTEVEQKSEEAFPGLDFGDEADEGEAEAPAARQPSEQTAREAEASVTRYGEEIYNAFIAGDKERLDAIVDRIKADVRSEFPDSYQQMRSAELAGERQREAIAEASPEYAKIVRKHDGAIRRMMEKTGCDYGMAFTSVAHRDIIQAAIGHGIKMERQRKGQDGGTLINGGRTGARASSGNLLDTIRNAGPAESRRQQQGYEKLFPPV